MGRLLRLAGQRRLPIMCSVGRTRAGYCSRTTGTQPCVGGVNWNLTPCRNKSALIAIEQGNFKKVVTNANITRDDKILSGVTEYLKNKGLEFIDVFKSLVKLGETK